VWIAHVDGEAFAVAARAPWMVGYAFQRDQLLADRGPTA
jgi:hypothetical protein